MGERTDKKIVLLHGYAQVIDASGSPFSLDMFKTTLAVNVAGTIDVIRLVCQHLVKVPPVGDDEERGVVIMVSSSAAVSSRALVID